MTQRGRWRGLAFALAGALGLASCGVGTPSTPAVPQNPGQNPGQGPGGTAPTPPSTCRYGLPAVSTYQRCDTLAVPLRHAEPQGPQLRLAYAVFGAGKVASKNATIVLTGGPGQGASESVLYPLTSALRQALPKDDVVIFDQRGVGRSEPTLDCRAQPALALLAPERFRADVRACLADFRSRGLPLGEFNTRASADDVAYLAGALGYERVNLYGLSYGTRLAQEVVRRHPGLVKAQILDGVLDPAESWLPKGTAYLHGALTRFGPACVAAGACPAGTDLVAGMAAAAAEVDRLGLTSFLLGAGGDPLPVTGDLVLLAARGRAYSPSDMASLRPLLDGVQRREVRAIDVLTNEAYRLPPGLSLGQFFAVVCQDNALDAASVDAAHAGLPAVFRRGAGLYRTLGEACAEAGLAPGALEPVTAAVPTLLISGRHDAITPPEVAGRVAPRFTPARHVVFEGGGHVNGLNSTCGLRLVLTFLNDPAAGLDTACAAAPWSGNTAPGTTPAPPPTVP